MQDNKRGTCSKCGQIVILEGINKAEYPNAADADELASYACVCDEGEEWRNAKQQEAENMRFTRKVEDEFVPYMQAHDLKRIAIRDNYGNSAVLLRMEKGEINTNITTKRVLQPCSKQD